MKDISFEFACSIWKECKLPFNENIPRSIFNFEAFCDYRDENMAIRIHPENANEDFEFYIKILPELIANRESYCIWGNEKQFDIILISDMLLAIEAGIKEKEAE